MKFLIAGLGSIGRRHLRNLLELGERDIILYRSRNSTLPESELEDFPQFSDLNEALAAGPGAVVISNPTALHLDTAILAARQGCHLLLEKPISHSFDRVDELVAAVEENQVRVLVGFQFRFHPGLRQIRRILSDGDLGKPLWARAHWGEHLEGWHPWEDYRCSYSARADLGGGVINTLCHPLDYLGWFFGPAAEVWANKAKLSDLELDDVEDIADINLSYKNGLLASVHVDYLQRPPSHNLQVICENGTILWDNRDGGVQILEPDSANQVIPAPVGFERNWMFLEEIKHFLAVARGDEDPICPLDDGIEILKLTLAAHTSAENGRSVTIASDDSLS